MNSYGDSHLKNYEITFINENYNSSYELPAVQVIYEE